MGGTCNTHGELRNVYRHFDRKSAKKETTLRGLDVDERLMLNETL
jgi:hypothetical protein